MDLSNSSILVTGGTGSFGRRFIDTILEKLGAITIRYCLVRGLSANAAACSRFNLDTDVARAFLPLPIQQLPKDFPIGAIGHESW